MTIDFTIKAHLRVGDAGWARRKAKKIRRETALALARALFAPGAPEGEIHPPFNVTLTIYAPKEIRDPNHVATPVLAELWKQLGVKQTDPMTFAVIPKIGPHAVEVCIVAHDAKAEAVA